MSVGDVLVSVLGPIVFGLLVAPFAVRFGDWLGQRLDRDAFAATRTHALAVPAACATAHGADASRATDVVRARKRSEQRELAALPADAIEASSIADRVQDVLEQIERELWIHDQRYERR